MPQVVALAGGVGGAKLAHGLQQVLAPGELAVVVNTADDEEFHGLLVCPDHDTVLYTLAGLADRERGWGLAGETWAAAETLARLGEPEDIAAAALYLAAEAGSWMTGQTLVLDGGGIVGFNRIS